MRIDVERRPGRQSPGPVYFRTVSDLEQSRTYPANYFQGNPPGNGDYFVSSNDSGKRMFTTGAGPGISGSVAIVTWSLISVT